MAKKISPNGNGCRVDRARMRPAPGLRRVGLCLSTGPFDQREVVDLYRLFTSIAAIGEAELEDDPESASDAGFFLRSFEGEAHVLPRRASK